MCGSLEWWFFILIDKTQIFKYSLPRKRTHKQKRQKMFTQNRPKRLMGSEEILAMCPWLWSTKTHWTKGLCSSFGSVHEMTTDVLTQRLDDLDRGLTIVIFDTSCLLLVYKQEYNKLLIGKSLAVNILDAIQKNTAFDDKERVIQGVVIISDGPVERSEHYYIYTGENLFPLIKASATEITGR